MPAILLALAISGGVIVVAQLLRALDLTPSPRSWGAQVAAILFGLAASTLTIAVANRLHRTLATTLDWIEDRVLRVRTARPQSAEAEALLREQLLYLVGLRLALAHRAPALDQVQRHRA